MKKFEYETFLFDCETAFDRYSEKETKFLNNKGNEGWELVSVVAFAPLSHLIDKTIYYFKREIE